MKKLSYLIAGTLLWSFSGHAQELFTNGAGIFPTVPGGNTNVGIGPLYNAPAFQLDVFAPAGANGARFNMDNFQYGSGNNVLGSPYSGAFGQANNIQNNSNECFAFGLQNNIDFSNASFAAGMDNSINNSPGIGGAMALGAMNRIDNSEHSAAIGEDNTIRNGHGSIALGGHNFNDGPYTVTIGSGLNNNMTNTIMAGFGTATLFVDGNNNRVGIGTTNPQVMLHVADSIRSGALVPGGNVCADANGTLYISGPCRSSTGGISNSCASLNFVPKTIDAAGNLNCSQIFDNGVSVGIGTVGPFNYTWAGGLTGPVLPPAAGIVKLDVNGVTRSLAYIATSDASLKSNIQEIPDAGSILQKVSGKTYHWNAATLESTGAADVRQYGFIAQEVAEVLPEAVSVDEKGLYGINYTTFIPLLTEAYKAQQTELDEKEAEINGLRSQLDDMMNQLAEMRDAINNMGGQLNTGGTQNGPMGGSSLEQNQPNPFSEATTIRFTVANNVQKAAIHIYNLKGKQKAQYEVEVGQTQIVVEQGSLEPGIYIYSLITDGQVVDTRRMMIQE